jgi:putative ABC transport system ATP-binding protein
VLTLENVVKHYPTGGVEPVRAVDGVSMTIEPGDFVALYGPSGSGKTTLLLLIAALLRADSGSIRFESREIATLSTREAARYRMHDVGIVRQDIQLVTGLTALDNAALKLAGSGMRVREARRKVSPMLERLGLRASLSQRAESLSMGERQRVMIARSLSTNPRLVLADEPTGNLDSRRSRQVLELLATVCQERRSGLLLVTHDPKAAHYADAVWALEDGQLVDHAPNPIVGVPVEP